MATRTLVVWCPDWPVVASGHGAGEPVAVMAANRVVACSAAARAEGVARGLRRRQAESRCPGIVVVPHDPGRDARAFEPVVAAVERCGPAAEILRPGMCAIATRGPSRYFGGDAALVASVTEAARFCRQNPTDVRVGVADGRFAAELAARRGRVIAPGASAAFLAPLAVSALARPDWAEWSELIDVLVRLGIVTLGDLAALPPQAVLARFGAVGAAAQRLAHGRDERPLAARMPPPDLDVSAELDPPAERVETAAFVARSLASQLHDELHGRGLACTRVRIEAETEHGESLSRLWRHDGALGAAALAERTRWQLDGWIASGATTAGITRLRLAPDEVRPDTGRQLGFWGGDAAAGDRASRALARVQGLLGPDAVTTAVLGGGRDPLEQVQLVPWGDEREPARPEVMTISGWGRPERTVWPGRLPPPSPATVHPDPLPAEVVDDDGRAVAVTGRGLATGAPARVSIAGAGWVDVAAWAGPWPVDERWWDPTARRRRARWQVVTADGAAHLLAVAGGRWSVEATYD
ncbi:MAG: repair protein [Acidimicrobiales bacterium]|nr:repair protein [Acidimicrobiales bacterium]